MKKGEDRLGSGGKRKEGDLEKYVEKFKRKLEYYIDFLYKKYKEVVLFIFLYSKICIV